MQDRLELEAGIPVRKNSLAHGVAIELPVSVEDLIAKSRANLVERGLAWLHDLTCDDVGVDDGYAEFREHVGNGRLTAGNAASQADSESLSVLRGRHSEHQVKVGVYDRFAPEHRDPAGASQVRAKRYGHAALMALEDHHADTHDGTDNRGHQDDHG